MAIVAAPPSGLRRIPVIRVGSRRRSLKRFSCRVMKDGAMRPYDDEKKEDDCGGLHLTTRVTRLEISANPSNMAPRIPNLEMSSGPSNLHFNKLQPSDEEPDCSRASDLRFNRLQPTDKECDCRHKRVFGRFVAREALLDEEYWTAAWLRAESHWEDRSDVRYLENFKRKFAEQEFNAIKRRCSRHHAEKCICIVAVKNDERNSKRTVLSSIVGTLDLSIRHLLCGETFPGECTKPSAFSSIYQADQPKYGYVANLCVARYARRQGIASNMLLLAFEAAKSYGADETFVHVHKDNVAAQKLYDRTGFQVVDEAIPHLLAENKYLLSFKT
ncbi:GCN5-related N-acetyltransferase 6, chloroplastic isoform X2 [Elaeis guineensis]|uniref:Uncharacterized protein LOC105056433 isoform X1 n=1 Tax=Elaeis guineensis var. tenera TaxID=51953 RepID=A0A6I9S3C6_ELAGV|nr:uncharacterized protein LOC105056433 isoform X1 [Elaeis guineensis]